MNAEGVLDTTIEGTQVLFDGVPAPLFYVSNTQINAQVPYAVAGRETVAVEVLVGGQPRGKTKVAVARAAPGIFTTAGGAGQAAAINEDGSLNSPENPASRGSAVVFYATGEGQTEPAGVDGQPAAAPLPRPVLPVDVRLGGLPVEVLYAGPAPGFAGLMQVNIRVPSGLVPTGNLGLELFVGCAVSQPGVTIAVR